MVTFTRLLVMRMVASVRSESSRSARILWSAVTSSSNSLRSVGESEKKAISEPEAKPEANSSRQAMTENELKTYVDVSHEDGVIESGEKEIIYNVFDFSDAVENIPTEMVKLEGKLGTKIGLNISKLRKISELILYFTKEDAEFIQLNSFNFMGHLVKNCLILIKVTYLMII